MNLRQIVEISHRLQTLSPGIKLIGFDIHENANTSHYFDVIFKIVAFSTPEPTTPSTGKGDKDKSRAKAKAAEPEEKDDE